MTRAWAITDSTSSLVATSPKISLRLPVTTKFGSAIVEFLSVEVVVAYPVTGVNLVGVRC